MTLSERAKQLIAFLTAKWSVLTTKVKTSWKLFTAIAVALVVVSFGALAYALRDRAPDPLVAGSEETAKPPVNLRQRALDGVLVDASSTKLLPIGVMVENSPDAWPLQGPAKANLVYEAEVEGGITRLFLVFDASSTISEIGPVRSARPYFVDWADGLEAMYAHVGGSPDALSKIVSLPDFRDLNEFWNGWAFWRSASRTAPHNVMTRMSLLVQAAEQEEFEAGTFEPWVYADAPTSTEMGEDELEQVNEGTSVTVPYAGIFKAEWRYDEEKDLYTRYRQGYIIRDADGTAVTAKNVVLMLTEAEVLDDIGRLKIRTTGRGKAIVASGGKIREVEWVRLSGQHIRFEGIDGSDVAFRRGTTWMSVITDSTDFDTVLP